MHLFPLGNALLGDSNRSSLRPIRAGELRRPFCIGNCAGLQKSLTFQAGGGEGSPVETREPYLPPISFLCGPHFFCKENSSLEQGGVCVALVSKVSPKEQGKVTQGANPKERET